MFDAVYLIKDSGILLVSCRSARLKKQQQQQHRANARDDLVSAFFTAIDQFAVSELGEEGIEHVQFKNDKCLYFKDITMNNGSMIKLVVFASGNKKVDVMNSINAKAIELKWALVEFIDHYDSSMQISIDMRAKIEDKIIKLFLS